MKVHVEPIGPNGARLDEAVAQALDVCQVQYALRGTRHRLLSAEFLSSELSGKPYGPAKHENDMFQATVYDYTTGRALFVNGIPFDTETVSLAAANIQPFVSSEEIREAARIAKVGRHVPFQGGMPPTIDRTFANGTSHRVVHIQTTSGNSSRSLYVNLSNGTVEHGPEPAQKLTTCEVTPPGPGPAVVGCPGTANIYITQGGKVLWTFQATRPAASSGHEGSAIVEKREIQGQNSPVSCWSANSKRAVRPGCRLRPRIQGYPKI